MVIVKFEVMRLDQSFFGVLFAVMNSAYLLKDQIYNLHIQELIIYPRNKTET